MSRPDEVASGRAELGSGARRRAIAFLAIAGAILWVPVAQLLLGRPPDFLRDLGFRSGPSGTAVAWGLALAVAVLYSAFAVHSIPLVRRHWRAPSLVKLFAIVVALAAAIVEEAFFRRLVMDSAMQRGGGSLVQIVASGLAFGLAHGVWGIVTGRIVPGVGAMIATGTLGLALGVVYVVGDRSLAPPIVSHFAITAVIQPGIMFAAFSGRMHRPRPA